MAKKATTKKTTSKKVVRRGATMKKTTTKKTTSWDGAKVFLAKLGESQIEVSIEKGHTVLDVFKNAVLPDGAFKAKNGQSIRNLVEAAEADVRAGRKRTIDQCFEDIRINAEPAKLTSEVNPDDIITLIPNISGGLS